MTLTPEEAFRHRILGCQWGGFVSTRDDDKTCFQTAVQMVALHSSPGDPTYITVKLCQHHLDVVMQHTTPTANPPT